jgi:integrase
MSNPTYRRCGCEDQDGRQYSVERPCPKMASDPRHGSWNFRLSYGSEPDPKRPGQMRRRQIVKGGFKSKRAAESARARLLASLDTGSYTEPSKKVLGPFAREVIARRRANGTLKPATLARYMQYVEQDIVPSKLGAMLLTSVRRAHVNAWVAELAATRGTVTVHRALATLRMILSAAVRDEIIGANPALMVDRPAVPDHPVTAWEPEHIAEFLERCGHHRLGPLYELAIYTGLRRGEICGLHWDDVDLAGRTIVVRHNRVSVDGRIEETTTKTRSGRRTVPLSDAATAALLTWQLRQAGEAEAAQEAWQTQGHVFTLEDGRALDPNYVTRLFQKIRKAGELPPLTFHGLRHSFVALLMASGTDIAVASKLAGHASISITSDTYGHLVGTVAQDAVNGAANLIAHKLHTQTGLSA